VHELLLRQVKPSVLRPSVIGQQRRFALAAPFGEEKHTRCPRSAAGGCRTAAGAAVIHKRVEEHYEEYKYCDYKRKV
jgi:hypothetical protein